MGGSLSGVGGWVMANWCEKPGLGGMRSVGDAVKVNGRLRESIGKRKADCISGGLRRLKATPS